MIKNQELNLVRTVSGRYSGFKAAQSMRTNTNRDQPDCRKARAITHAYHKHVRPFPPQPGRQQPQTIRVDEANLVVKS